jgi:anti-sigma-K factor RskA
VIVPAALLTTDPRAFELSLIPTGEVRPCSLGLVQPGHPIRLEILPTSPAGSRRTPRSRSRSSQPAARRLACLPALWLPPVS